MLYFPPHRPECPTSVESFRRLHMPNYQALSKKAHADQRFKGNSSYGFASGDALAPLVQQELAKACTEMPIAFVQNGDSVLPVAVQGFESGRNLRIAPNGEWVGKYIPSVYRGYPFALLPDQKGQLALCFDADSQLINAAAGQALFDAQGEPSPVTQGILDFLHKVEQNRQLTLRLCQSLAEHKLLQPWPIKVQTEAGVEKTVSGVLRIDETALNQLDGAALQALQRSGALAIAYMQLLSMQHLPAIALLSRSHAKFKEQQSEPTLVNKVSGELDLEFLNGNGTFSFATK